LLEPVDDTLRRSLPEPTSPLTQDIFAAQPVQLLLTGQTALTSITKHALIMEIAAEISDELGYEKPDKRKAL